MEQICGTEKCAGCDGPRRSIAVRSYPSPKVRGSDQECQTAAAQEWRSRGASPRLRSGAVAERSFPTPEVRGPAQDELPQLQGAAAARAQEGREELLHIQRQEGQPCEDTIHPR